MKKAALFTIISMLAVLVLPANIHAQEDIYPLVGVVCGEAFGSGSIIAPSGYVLTNYHVLEGAGYAEDGEQYCTIEVIEDIGQWTVPRYIARAVNSDFDTDWAILKIEYDADGYALEPGMTFPYYGTYPNDHVVYTTDKVYAEGYPVIGGFTYNITEGIISGFYGDWYYKISSEIDQGNSGGALVDADGYLIGVPTYAVTNIETQGYALRIDMLQWALDTSPDVTEQTKADLDEFIYGYIETDEDAVASDEPVPTLYESSESIVEKETGLVTSVDSKLSARLKGKILLQVEANGEAWYVFPDDLKKYYLGRPADAFSIMRSLGLGIAHGTLQTYLNSTFPSRLSGKILLDVEANGEAYYVYPGDLKGYYLGRPDDAFQIMREKGLGISNTDLRKIAVGLVD